MLVLLLLTKVLLFPCQIQVPRFSSSVGPYGTVQQNILYLPASNSWRQGFCCSMPTLVLSFKTNPFIITMSQKPEYDTILDESTHFVLAAEAANEVCAHKNSDALQSPPRQRRERERSNTRRQFPGEATYDKIVVVFISQLQLFAVWVMSKRAVCLFCLYTFSVNMLPFFSFTMLLCECCVCE